MSADKIAAATSASADKKFDPELSDETVNYLKKQYRLNPAAITAVWNKIASSEQEALLSLGSQPDEDDEGANKKKRRRRKRKCAEKAEEEEEQQEVDLFPGMGVPKQASTPVPDTAFSPLKYTSIEFAHEEPCDDDEGFSPSFHYADELCSSPSSEASYEISEELPEMVDATPLTSSFSPSLFLTTPMTSSADAKKVESSSSGYESCSSGKRKRSPDQLFAVRAGSPTADGEEGEKKRKMMRLDEILNTAFLLKAQQMHEQTVYRSLTKGAFIEPSRVA
uniref:Uncharacterized protein n=1 Tax=Palpitomonas bilix TaxID=652834 RepID=A0A7S3GLZ8_9EUKA|mmetsp:Transcript_9256/g.25185  ORF Transcript_9256/g.25185 Transcript_9256/m.25185 type:complete len:279 (+) Transcript_9256:201-1037(+)